MWKAAGGAGVCSTGSSVGIMFCVHPLGLLLYYGQTHLRWLLLPCSVLLRLSQTGAFYFHWSPVYSSTSIWRSCCLSGFLTGSCEIYIFLLCGSHKSECAFELSWGLEGMEGGTRCWKTCGEAFEALNPVCPSLLPLASLSSCDQ